MQIIIIGAGIAGLSSYLFLTKHLSDGNNRNTPIAHTIKIFETYDIRPKTNDDSSSSSSSDDNSTHSHRTIGSAIGIGKNGLAVLSRIDDTVDILSQLKRRGNSISKWRMGTARGFKLVDAVVESSPGRDGEKKGVSQPTVMILRQTAWEILRDKVLEVNADAVTVGKVVKISSTNSGPITVTLEDGSSHTADLVIGADGIKSEVRRTMFEFTEDTKPLSWWGWLSGQPPRKKDYITPHYEGLTGVGGIVPGAVLREAGFEPGAMAITFGANGFFGYGYMTPESDVGSSSTSKDVSQAAWWSTFSSPSPYLFQNPSSKTTSTSTNDSPTSKTSIDKPAALSNLTTRHASWRDPVIRAIVSHVTQNNALDHIYPTYTTPELPTWHLGHSLVLIGDAAHALQPSSGQGACQALEDSEALALLLSHYLRVSTSSGKTDVEKALTATLQMFDKLRKPRLSKIYLQSQKFGKMKGDMNVLQEFVMYFFVWFGNWLGGWKEYNDGVFEYDLPREVRRAVRQG